jgi:hypothetical protein
MSVKSGDGRPVVSNARVRATTVGRAAGHDRLVPLHVCRPWPVGPGQCGSKAFALTWGATAEEAAARLPGDELLEEAGGVAARAITIDAPRSAVWPWIAQMGPSPRGSASTYDWIENVLGLDMHSVERVLPDYQHPQVEDDFGYGTNKMTFTLVEPKHVLATQSADGNWVWTVVLEELDGGTRLISRNRFRLPTLTDKTGMIPMEPGSLVMERKMLLGIKQRAERLAAEEKEPTHV